MSLISIDIDALADAVAERVVRRMSAREPAALLNRSQVAERIGRSVSTVKRLIADPRFPRPVRLADGRPQWRTSDIEAWISRAKEQA